MNRYFGIILTFLFVFMLAACQSTPRDMAETNAVTNTPSFSTSSTPAPDALLSPSDLTVTQAEVEWQATLSVNQTQNAYSEATRNIFSTQVAFDKTQTALAPTPPPIQTPPPISTVSPGPLSENGPWLVFYDLEKAALIAINPDGFGSRTLLADLPVEPIWVGSTKNQLAIITEWGEIEAAAPRNMALLILRLPDGDIQDVVPLVTYPDIPEENLPFFSDTSLAWSSDGNYLAFIGAINGPSADVYVYEAFTGNITRLTTGENRANFPQWSPDGKWIIHEERTNIPEMCDSLALWAVTFDASETKKLMDDGCNLTVLDWLDHERFLSIDISNGDRDLRVVNIPLEESILLSPNIGLPSREGVAWDIQSGQVAYEGSAMGAEKAEEMAQSLGVTNGVFVLKMSDPTLRLVSEDYYWFIHWFPGASRFIGYPDEDCGVAIFARDVEKTCLMMGERAYVAGSGSVEFNDMLANGFAISPDGQWLAIASDQGVDLYNANLEKVNTFGLGEASLGSVEFGANFAWSPLSNGFVYQTQGGVSYANILDGQTYPLASINKLAPPTWRVDSTRVLLIIGGTLYSINSDTLEVELLSVVPGSLIWVGAFPP